MRSPKYERSTDLLMLHHVGILTPLYPPSAPLPPFHNLPRPSVHFLMFLPSCVYQFTFQYTSFSLSHCVTHHSDFIVVTSHIHLLIATRRCLILFTSYMFGLLIGPLSDSTTYHSTLRFDSLAIDPGVKPHTHAYRQSCWTNRQRCMCWCTQQKNDDKYTVQINTTS